VKNLLKILGLTKQFGEVTAVDEVSFQVSKGEIFALLGENGAGKTTTLRMLATMLQPTSGTAELAGYDLVTQPEKVRSRIGILFGGESGLYDRLTAAENIAYFGRLNNMEDAQLRERIQSLVTYADNVKHTCIPHALGYDKWSGNLFYGSFAHIWSTSLSIFGTVTVDLTF
jgi:sodium transport system ATP-binding protein